MSTKFPYRFYMNAATQKATIDLVSAELKARRQPKPAERRVSAEAYSGVERRDPFTQDLLDRVDSRRSQQRFLAVPAPLTAWGDL